MDIRRDNFGVIVNTRAGNMSASAERSRRAAAEQPNFDKATRLRRRVAS
jgi:hypothetical protein